MPRPLRTYRTHALVLRHRDMGEADRLITILTPEHGKMDCVAKGARKPATSKTGHVELFTHTDLLIAKGSSLDIVTQAQMQNPYLILHEDLLRGAYASYCVELMDRFTQEDDVDNAKLFYLLDATFERLCYDDDVRRVVRYYEMQLLNLAGFKPQLMECIITHELVVPEDQFFSYSEGGVVSSEGAVHTNNLIALPVETLKLMRHLQRTKDYSKLHSLKIGDVLHNDIERVMVGFIRYILESKLRSIEFIRLLQH